MKENNHFTPEHIDQLITIEECDLKGVTVKQVFVGRLAAYKYNAVGVVFVLHGTPLQGQFIDFRKSTYEVFITKILG